MEKKFTERVEEILFQYQSTMHVKMNMKRNLQNELKKFYFIINVQCMLNWIWKKKLTVGVEEILSYKCLDLVM